MTQENTQHKYSITDILGAPCSESEISKQIPIPEEADLTTFSEALRIMDHNTEVYMVEQLQKKNAELEAKNKKLKQKMEALNTKKAKIKANNTEIEAESAAKDAQIKALEEQLAALKNQNNQA